MIAIVDYGMGNLKSVHNAFKFIAPAIDSVVTSDPKVINNADRVVFPGQGAMPDCIREIEERNLEDAIIHAAQSKPFLGICIGLQLLFEKSDEGNIEGLKILKGNVCRFVSSKTEKIKIPHMGWNSVAHHGNHPLWTNISNHEKFYFVHSYAVAFDQPATIATADHGISFAAVVRHKNFWATQFHPEKSAGAGQRLLQGFLDL